jgi:hypothetical protein
MLAFLKRWRQAYLEDKGNRLHAELEEERNALCHGCIPIERVADELSKNTTSWKKALHNAHEECTRYEEEQAYYN